MRHTRHSSDRISVKSPLGLGNGEKPKNELINSNTVQTKALFSTFVLLHALSCFYNASSKEDLDIVGQ